MQVSDLCSGADCVVGVLVRSAFLASSIIFCLLKVDGRFVSSSIARGSGLKSRVEFVEE